MPYSEMLAERVRHLLGWERSVSERRMFGGLAFMVRGHMCCGISGEKLMARVGPERHDEALTWPHATHMDFTGKPMHGFLYVHPAGLKTGLQLRRWVDACVTYVRSLPPKKPRGAARSATGKRRRERGAV
jgi:hypothetical protein